MQGNSIQNEPLYYHKQIWDLFMVHLKLQRFTVSSWCPQSTACVDKHLRFQFSLNTCQAACSQQHHTGFYATPPLTQCLPEDREIGRVSMVGLHQSVFYVFEDIIK